MPEPKITTTVRVDPKAFRFMSEMAKKTGIPFTRLADRAFAEFVAREKEKQPAA